MIKKRRFPSIYRLVLTAALCLVMGLPGTAAAESKEDGRCTFTIFHLNDVHSFLDSEPVDLMLDHTLTTCDAGEMSRVAGLVKELAGSSETYLLLHGGDALQGTLYYTLFNGKADAGVMNAMGTDAMAIGNHEFDNGDDGLVSFLQGLTAQAISANITVLLNHPLEPLISPYIVREIGGSRVGIIGLTPARATRTSSRPGPELQFTDEVHAIRAAVASLSDLGIGKIILVSHYGYNNDLALAPKIPGLDVIVGGHSHTLLGEFQEVGLNSRGPYPTVTVNADGDPVCVVQAWEHGKVLGDLTVTFAGDTLLSWQGTPHLVLGDRFYRTGRDDTLTPLSGDALSRVLASIQASDVLALPEADPSVSAVVEGYSKEVEVVGRTVIGTSRENLRHIRLPGTPVNGAPLPLGSETAPLVAKAFYSRIPGADISIQNAGGVRTGIRAGNISYDSVYEMLPFANTLYQIEMTGAQIHQVLEEALAYAIATGSDGAFPYAYALKYDVDTARSYGNRFFNLEVKNRISGRYAPLQEEITYQVVTSNYLAEGHDGYDTFAAVCSREGAGVDTYVDYALAFVTYVKEITAAGGPLSRLPAADHCIKSYRPLQP